MLSFSLSRTATAAVVTTLKKIIKNYIVHNEIKEEKIKIAIERSKCYAL